MHIKTDQEWKEILSEEEYLKQLCRNGWSDMLIKTGKVEKEQAIRRRKKQQEDE